MKVFKILDPNRYKISVKSVPWHWIAPHEAQALRNHGQSLEKLNSRGGLSPYELYAVIHDVHSREIRHVTMDDAITWLESIDFSKV